MLQAAKAWPAPIFPLATASINPPMQGNLGASGTTRRPTIPGLAVDRAIPNRLLAAVLGHPYGPSEERGVSFPRRRQNWTKVLYKNENTGGDQVEFDPSNPDILYASMWSVRQAPWEDGNEYQQQMAAFSNPPTGQNLAATEKWIAR